MHSQMLGQLRHFPAVHYPRAHLRRLGGKQHGLLLQSGHHSREETDHRCVLFQVNLFFLLNIVRVLITKLRVTHQAESSLYMRAVRATLILIPLLGIQFVLLPYKPQDHWVFEIYLYIMEILMHYQVSAQSSAVGSGLLHNCPMASLILWFKITNISRIRAWTCDMESSCLSLRDFRSCVFSHAGSLGFYNILLLQRGGE